MIALVGRWLARRQAARAEDDARWREIREHPILGARCTLCGKPRYVPPTDECYITHDLEFLGAG